MIEGVGARAAVVAAALIVTAGGVALAAPLQEQREQEERATQLEVFERLLTETVQARVETLVNSTIDRERRGDPDGDGEAETAAVEPLVVKVGRPLAAHGIYVTGYGVMFSIQTPQVAVIPSGFEAQLAAPLAPFSTFRVAPDTMAAGGRLRSFGVIELRADMLQRGLEELQVIMRDQPQVIDAEALQEIGRLHVVLEEIKSSVAAEPAGDEEARLAVPAPSPQGRTYSRRRSSEFFRGLARQQRSMKEILERNHTQIAGSMNEAAIETLARYGGVIKGLDNDDRISVVVTPPNRWAVADRHGVGIDSTEHVISVRYKDIRDYDNQKIDFAEFRRRAEIHDRLGMKVRVRISEDDGER